MFRNSLILLSVFYFINLGNTLGLRQPGLWQDLPIQCYACQGDECKEVQKKTTPCNTDYKATCYTVFEQNAVVSRGCKPDVLKTTSEYCNKNPTQCFECTSNRCNTPSKIEEYIDCYVCNSEDDDRCVSITNTTTVPTTKCNKSCMTAIYPQSTGKNPKYEIVRSCLDDMEMSDQAECQKPDSTFCSSCEGAKCNSGNFPPKRLVCNKCNTDKGDCIKPKSEPCAVYDKYDQCAFTFSGTELKSLGCKSDFAQSIIANLVHNNEVSFCDGDNCNTIDKKPKTQSCKKCNSLTNVACATAPDSVKEMEVCNNFPNTQCFTKLKDGQIERGCAMSLEKSEGVKCILNELENCKICYGDNCNNGIYPIGRRQCHRCNSKDHKECEKEPKSSSICPKYVEGDSCIAWENNGTTIRDCASEITCNGTDTKHCVICNTNDCNTVVFKSSGSKPVANLLVTSLFVGIISFLIKF